MKSKNMTGHFVASLLIGLAVGLLITILIAGVGAYLITTELAGENKLDLFVVLGLLCGSITASAVVAAREEGRRILMSLAGGGAYYFGLLCFGVMLFDGIKGGVGMTAFVTFGGAVVTWLLGMNRGKKQKIKVPKLRL